MRLAAIQLDIAWEDRTTNFDRASRWIEAAAAAEADLAVLPEMFSCGFSMATERVAEPFDGPSAEFLCAQAAKHGLHVAGSVPELGRRSADAASGSTDPRPFNSFLVASPGGIIARYAKRNPFRMAGEHKAYREGHDTTVVTIGGMRWGLFICYDLRFADDFWHLAPQVDGYLVVANWPVARAHHWTTLLQARAIENQAYVVGVNRVGSGGSLRYRGDSRIVDPLGQTLAHGAEGETLLIADVDPAITAAVRRDLPFLGDRRPSATTV